MVAKYYINLASRVDRRASMERQSFVQDAVRVEAITPKELPDNLVVHPAILKRFHLMADVEKACFLSHVKMWNMAVENNDIEDNDYILFFEDDVFFPANIESTLAEIIKRGTELNLDFIQCINKYSDKEFSLRPATAVEIDTFTNACCLIKKSLLRRLVDMYYGKGIAVIADIFSVVLPKDTKVGVTTGKVIHLTPESDMSDIAPHTIIREKQLCLDHGIRLKNWFF